MQQRLIVAAKFTKQLDRTVKPLLSIRHTDNHFPDEEPQAKEGK